MNEFFESYQSPDPALSLVVEDDGRVAYGYLLVDKEIIGDVWLYNQAETPSAPEWKDESKAPFLNPSAYVDQPSDFAPITSSSELRIKWVTENGEIVGAHIFIRGRHHATVRRAQKPGACRFARKDGPLAKVLINPEIDGPSAV